MPAMLKTTALTGLMSLVASLVFVSLLGVGLFAPAPAAAAAMRCSGEQTACIAACKKSAPAAALSMCITNCGQRQAICVKSGCWDSGTQKYCGLLRQ